MMTDSDSSNLSEQQRERLNRAIEAAEALPVDQREAHLRAELADDPGLLEVALRLLDHLNPTASFMNVPHELADEVSGLMPGSKPVPERIGPYRILQQIGEGGMGVVYLAEQTEPVRRRVALKIIKLGMDSKQVIARFEAERQALAVMDHPYVAKVLDAGVTPPEAGSRPYFVMEHVPGVSITEHCDRQRLDIETRLELFMRVCEAVQHAHQKGIIHRDIKPSNILIDASGAPKVIDFGVAKALHQKLTEKTLFTEQGQLIGTPEYMSPEQAEMTAQDIDTRSDIYSLGVLLYELLTGALPFDPTTLRRAAFGEIQRIIREEEPPRPSTRLSSLGDVSATHAQKRGADTRSLARELRGDLDWITMKALEKDRNRRYETANGLAADIRRHLSHEPVLAGPPSATYRMSKFIRRNRTGVLAGVVVAMALITASIVSIALAMSEAEQRTLAEDREQEARIQAEIAEAVNNFLNDDLLAAVAPSAEQGQGKDVLMRDVLDEAAKRIEDAAAPGGKFHDKPLVEASIRATLGLTYFLLSEFPNADPHLERARLLRDRELGAEHPDTLKSTSMLAILYMNQDRSDEAEPLFVETLGIRKRILGDEHPDTLRSMSNLAALIRSPGRYDEAEPLYLKTLEIRKRILGDEHPDTLKSLNDLAILYMVQGRYDEAEPLYVETLEIQKRILGNEHPDTLKSISTLAILYHNQRRYDEAESLYVMTLEGQKVILGDEHANTLGSMNNLASLFMDQGRYDEAEPLLVKALEGQEHVFGDEHPKTLVSKYNLGSVYLNQSRYDEAEPLLLETLEIQKRVLGEEHEHRLGTLSSLAILYFNQGRYEEAETLAVKTLEIQKRVLGDDHLVTLASLNNLATLYDAQGRYDEAETLYVKTLEIYERVYGEEHSGTLNTMYNLAALYYVQGRYDEAEPLFVKTLENQKRILGEEHPDTLRTMSNLVRLYSTQGRTDDARPLVRELLDLQRRRAEQSGATADDKNAIAWDLLTIEPADLRDPAVALEFARDACEMTNNAIPAILDTLALAQHLTGDTAAAIETEKKALALLPADAPGRSDYEAALARFEAALEDESN